MLSSQLVSVTAQAAVFSALSTSLAQGISAWQEGEFKFDPTSFITFMIIAIITTPPNFLYQKLLEDSFPSMVVVSEPKVTPSQAETKKNDDVGGKDGGDRKERLSKFNTAAKFILEQSFGAAANTVLFIFLIGTLKGKSMGVIGQEINKDFWPMLTTGWRVWPVVTMLNLCVIPFDYRPLVGNTAGLMWGVYITLKTM